MKTLKYLAGAMLGLCSLANATELVLNLGTSSYRIPLATSANITINPNNHEITARPLVTSGTAGDGWCPAGGGGGTAPTVSFSQSTTLIQPPPGNVTLSWTTSNVTGATCSTTGSYPAGVTSVSGWNSTIASNTSGNVALTLSTVGTYQFTISCVGTGGTTTQTKTVSVQNAVVGNCTGHEPPAGMARMQSFSNTTNLRNGGNQEWSVGTSLSVTSWNPDPTSPPNSAAPTRAVIGKFGFTTGDTAVIPIPSSQYAAFQIDTSTQTSNKYGAISSEQPGENSAPLFMTISPCAGDPNPTEPRCKSDYGIAGMGWTFGSTPGTYCPMTIGTTYYLNVFFRQPNNTSVSDCTVGTCWWLMRQSCQNGCSP
ncbi:hypothetical protein C7S18_22120 [Ahniella affigens]|uniref:Ig-like domain-containing protein n=1 Tax=Ahniella affigens TaxID=2021234 RepID=A0A2P1PY14_9GAMM|nr:hypothetical protein [Ahniella affigens]AVP99704.1 hypothetical protein C7S18_22120 [Ahniella affigens]